MSTIYTVAARHNDGKTSLWRIDDQDASSIDAARDKIHGAIHEETSVSTLFI